MDKYIRMLIVKLSAVYDVTVITVMGYNTEKQTIRAKHMLKIVRRSDEKIICQRDFYSKPDLVKAMAAYG